jgi:uncharacterized protein (DUF305 family)
LPSPALWFILPFRHERRRPLFGRPSRFDLNAKAAKNEQNRSFLRFSYRDLLNSGTKFVSLSATALLTATLSAAILGLPARGQQSDSSAPVVVQPGAPGQPTKTLPPSTKGVLPPQSRADGEFMQGMIMHHAQAIEMTGLIPTHTQNKDLHLLGAKISSSQTDEIKFMKRWLIARGQPLDMQMHGEMQAMGDGSAHHSMLMPGMLTPEQMGALRKATGAEFDRLFLTGMIQHHGGALTMVKDLFNTPGAGQDAEIFGFATDVDTGQRAEIKIMQNLLDQKSPEKSSEEKR